MVGYFGFGRVVVLGAVALVASACSGEDRQFEPGPQDGGGSGASGGSGGATGGSGGTGASGGSSGTGGSSGSAGSGGSGGSGSCPGSEADACGANCVDCTQPNTTAICNGSQCANVCVGATFPAATCPGPGNGKPACGSWDFESGTTEGWVLYDEMYYPASNGPIAPSSTRAILNTSSLAIPMKTGGQVDSVAIKIKLCSGGQALAVNGKKLKARVYYDPAPGVNCYMASQGLNHIELFNGSTRVYGGADYQVPCGGPSWYSFEFDLLDEQVTEIGFVFRVFIDWTGTVYFDDVRIE